MKKNGTRDWVLIILAIVSMIAGICIAYGDLNRRTNTAETNIADTKIEVKAVWERVGVHDTVIMGIQKDISYIVAGVDDLKRERGLSVRRRASIDPNN